MKDMNLNSSQQEEINQILTVDRTQPSTEILSPIKRDDTDPKTPEVVQKFILSMKN